MFQRKLFVFILFYAFISIDEMMKIKRIFIRFVFEIHIA
jgi:hypothetical protein